MKIAFLGTPDFAVPSLQALCDAGHEVVAVFTQPDRKKGRGGKTSMPPVKALALDLGIPVHQPVRIRNPKWVRILSELNPDAMVTAAFGQILSPENLAIPRLGCINVHGSLLPRYRGPAPIQWAIINGEDTTGITTMYTDVGIDTGDMILKREEGIRPEDTAGTLSDRLSRIGAELLIETLQRIEAGNAPREPQDERDMTYFPMLTKEIGRISWNQNARQIVDLIRGIDPWPGAFIPHERGAVKIWRARAAEAAGEPGEVLASGAREGLVIGCRDGAVEILEIQAPGAKRLSAADFLRGKAGWFPVGMRMEASNAPAQSIDNKG